MKSNEWWRGAVIYQIYPRSYADSNSDGVGDLKGITDKLDYVASLGVDAVWLSPFYKSPMKDFGYDVADYRDIDPLFGTIEDFKVLLDKAHKLGLKIIIDFVLTHSSDQHQWFQESRSSRDNDKADWYIWADPKPDGTPPNNWQSHFGGPSWTYDIKRGQYYFHNFLPEQPDINLRSPAAKQAIFDVAKFWLDMGVDGFRLDAARHYFCDPEFKDNPPNPAPTSIWFDHPTPFTMQIHKNDVHIPDTVRFMEELRTVLDQYENRMAVAEIGGEDSHILATQYTNGPKRIHTSYTFRLTSGEKASASNIRDALNEFLGEPGQAWPSWAFSTHDVERAASRWHPDKDGNNTDPRLSRMLIGLLCSLYGTAFIYQGEELGLPEATIPYEKIQDPWGKYLYPVWQGRDGCRTPIPWDSNKKNAGFSQADQTWLPIEDKHLPLSVADQENQKDSPLHFTRAFLQWRKKQPALWTGKIEFLDFNDDDVLGFIRHHKEQKLLCLYNLADKEKIVTLPVSAGENIFDCGTQSGTVQAGDKVSLPAFGLFYSSLAD